MYDFSCNCKPLAASVTPEPNDIMQAAQDMAQSAIDKAKEAAIKSKIPVVDSSSKTLLIIFIIDNDFISNQDLLLLRLVEWVFDVRDL